MDCQHCYEVGIQEGYQTGYDEARRGMPARDVDEGDRRTLEEIKTVPIKRKATAANKRYSKAFKKVKSKYMKKNGGWKKNGFRNCCRAAHKMCK